MRCATPGIESQASGPSAAEAEPTAKGCLGNPSLPAVEREFVAHILTRGDRLKVYFWGSIHTGVVTADSLGRFSTR
jgi:hypothetical protein